MHGDVLQVAFTSRDLDRLVALMDEGVVWRGAPPSRHHHDEDEPEHDHGVGICRDRTEVHDTMRYHLDQGVDADLLVVAEAGDSVAVELRIRAIPGAPEQGALPRYQVFTFRGGRIVLIQDYLDRGSALASLG